MKSVRNLSFVLCLLLLLPLLNACVEKNVYDEEHYSLTEPELINQEANYPQSDSSVDKTGTYAGHDYVDLGLPSGLLWATSNVGALSIEAAPGDYFAWGETSLKNDYSMSTYKWYDSGFTKYVASSYYGLVDNRTVLELSDDVANALWGGSWRMPTKEEWTELVNYTTKEWTSYGYIFTGKNGGRLFLPVTGYITDTTMTDLEGGYYWSSSLQEEYSELAWCVNFNSSHVYVGDFRRSYGGAVRPVYTLLTRK